MFVLFWLHDSLSIPAAPAKSEAVKRRDESREKENERNSLLYT